MVILKPHWTIEEAKVASCPTVLAGRKPQVIVGTTEGDVVSYDGSGRERWRTPLGGCISAWPVVMDLPSCGKNIFASNEEGMLACISQGGRVRWKSEIEAPIHPWNSISPIHGGGDASILVTDRDGRVTALGDDGTPKWRFHTYARGAGPAAVGDIDGDGRDEILFCCGEGRLYCLDGRGRYRWNVRFKEPSEYSAPVLGDLGRGPCVLTGSADDILRCISPVGRVIWEQRGAGVGGIEVGLSLGDLDGDGQNELVYVHGGTGIQALNGDGSLLWSRSYGGGDQPFGPTIGDIDGDGWMELLLAQRSGPTFRVLTHDGYLLEEHELPGGMLGGPVIADVDGDGKIEVVAMSRETGRLICYKTTASLTPHSVPWPNSRGGFATRGNQLGRVGCHRLSRPAGSGIAIGPEVRGGLRLGENLVGFYPKGSWKSNRSVEVGLREADGLVERGVLHNGSQKVEFEILRPGRKHLMTRLFDSKGRELGRGHMSRMLSAFKVEKAAAKGLLNELQGLAGEIPDVEEVVRKRRIEWTYLEEDIQSYPDLGRPGRRDLIGRVARFLARIEREVECQKKRSVMDGHPVFLAWKPRHPWTPFDPQNDHPPDDLIREIRLLTEERSHDALVVQVANVLAETLSVRAWTDLLVSGEGQEHPAGYLLLRRVAWVPTASGSMGADALPELGNAGLVQIGPSSSERIWIDVMTGGLPAGEYRTTLHLRALVPEESIWHIPIKWTVVEPALPQEMPLKFCNWGYVHSSPLKEIQEASVRDMQEHHTSVFVLTGEWTPRATYDRKGDLVEIDWQRFDWLLERLRPQDMVLLIGGTPVAEKGGTDEDSPEWERAFRSFLPMLVDRLASHGLGYDRWAFYPVDEPGLFGGRLIDILERRARAYKAVDPSVQVYTDPVRGMRLEDLERVLPLVDIFQPNFNGIVKKPTRERIDFLKSTGKTLWTYECSGEVKDMVGVRYYWEPVWTAWELGMTGVGFWSYCTRAFDLWQGPNPRGNDWEMVYQGESGPVPSVRWQAIRIAIEDYARLHSLRELGRGAREMGLLSEAGMAEKAVEDAVRRARRGLWDPEVVARIRSGLIEKTAWLAELL